MGERRRFPSVSRYPPDGMMRIGWFLQNRRVMAMEMVVTDQLLRKAGPYRHHAPLTRFHDTKLNSTLHDV